MYVEVTQDIEVSVEPVYVPEQSRPEDSYYFFAYRVHIKNLSPKRAKLLSRHWIIIDGKGHKEEVKGMGVVGEQPDIGPGDSYEYVSFCPLPTPTGNMRGSYQMIDGDGKPFEISVPVFFFWIPDSGPTSSLTIH